jgi:hypothetical protein
LPGRPARTCKSVVLAVHAHIHAILGDGHSHLDRTAADDAILDVRLPSSAELIYRKLQRLAAIGALGFDVHVHSADGKNAVRKSSDLPRHSRVSAR